MVAPSAEAEHAAKPRGRPYAEREDAPQQPWGREERPERSVADHGRDHGAWPLLRIGSASGRTSVASLLVCVALGALAAPVRAQEAPLPAAMQVAWADRAPRVDDASAQVVTVALGLGDAHGGPLAARRLWARRDAEARARAALHTWVDHAIERAGLDAARVAALHQAVDAHAAVAAIRARVDGSACVELHLPVSALAAVTGGARGLPWSP